jgi:hypothetical protein
MRIETRRLKNKVFKPQGLEMYLTQKIIGSLESNSFKTFEGLG